MRKRRQGRTLSRNAAQRKALRRTMLTSLVASDSIKTTLAKARELKPFAERMITRAKKAEAGDRNSLSIVIRQLKKDVTAKTAKQLIAIAEGYKDRNGGYLRIIKLAPRKSDAAEMAVLQWVGTKKNVAKKEGVSTKGIDSKKDDKNIKKD